jgi:hypothetical protein
MKKVIKWNKQGNFSGSEGVGEAPAARESSRNFKPDVDGFLSILAYYQEHYACWVSEKLNNSLFHWICNQKTYLRLYNQGKEEGDKFQIDNRYIKFLTKLGMSVKESWESIVNSN